MSEPLFIPDGEILWLAITKVGNPPAWQANANYSLGDIVVPTNPQPGQEELAFQVVGFLKKSNAIEPVFPVTAGAVLTEGQIEWVAVDPTKNPDPIDYNQYYLIDQTVTTS